MKKKRWYSGHLLSDPLFSIFGKSRGRTKRNLHPSHRFQQLQVKYTHVEIKIARGGRGVIRESGLDWEAR